MGQLFRDLKSKKSECREYAGAAIQYAPIEWGYSLDLDRKYIEISVTLCFSDSSRSERQWQIRRVSKENYLLIDGPPLSRVLPTVTRDEIDDLFSHV